MMKKRPVFYLLIFIFCLTGMPKAFSAGQQKGSSKEALLEKRNQSLLEENASLYKDVISREKENFRIKNKLSTLQKENDNLSSQFKNYKEEVLKNQKEEIVLKKALTLPQQSPYSAKKAAYYHLGSIYAKNKQLDKAIEEYKKILEIEPKDKNAHFNLGYLYNLKEDFSTAVKEYEEVLNIDPLDKQAHYNLAIIFYKNLKNDDEARRHYEEFLK